MEICRVTDLKQGVKNENRVNVHVDGKFAFSLDIAQVVDFGIKIGLEISADDLAKYKDAAEFGKLYQRALKWVLVRPRSEREVRDYLKKKIYEKKVDKKYISEIIEKLKSRGYLDDYKFAEYYVENRFVKKGVSTKRLEIELMKKGIKKEIIDEAMEKSERNDEEEIRKIIAKKRTKYSAEKMIAYLCRQGFNYDLSRELVSQYEMD